MVSGGCLYPVFTAICAGIFNADLGGSIGALISWRGADAAPPVIGRAGICRCADCCQTGYAEYKPGHIGRYGLCDMFSLLADGDKKTDKRSVNHLYFILADIYAAVHGGRRHRLYRWADIAAGH